MSLVYNRFKKECFDGSAGPATVTLLSDTIKAMLVNSGYTANADNDFVDAGGANDPIDQELSGTGYAAGYAGAGRKTLASKTIVESDASDRAEFDAADLTWTAISAGTAAAWILHKHGAADDTTGKLIGYINTGGFPLVTNGGDMTIQHAAAGILTLT